MRRVLSFFQTIIGFAFLVLLLIPIIGPPLYIEIGGTRASGTITAKREVINVASEIWTRHLLVDVQYQPSDTTEEASVDVAVDATTYDQLRVGAPVQIRYIPHPLLRHIRGIAASRLESQWPFESFVARMGPFLIGTIVGIAIWLALLSAWAKWKHWWLALALLIYMFSAVIYIGSGWPAPAPAGATEDSEATVRALHRVDRVWGGHKTPAEDAVQPYTIVELTFVPAGMTDPVVGVDLIDAESVAGVEAGATLPIRYSVSNARWVQIDGATRTYYWKNLRSFGIIALLLLLLIFVSWGVHRWRAARQSGQGAP